MLTRRENEILACTAIGLSAKEIADHLCRSEFTVLKTISNVKAKVGLQKSTELAASYWIERLGCGLTFSELKKQILASIMSICLIFSCLNFDASRRTGRGYRLIVARRHRIEFIEDIAAA